MGYKRIIDGKTYNTDTSACVFEVTRQQGSDDLYDGLYQTKHGACFIYWYDEHRETGGIKPLSDTDALKWLETYKAPAEVIERHFGKFPDAGAGESRVTLRLPGNLYQRVVASAEAANCSLNTYIMRLLEQSERPVT